ncbi:MAG: cytochrome c biogenesis protein [Methanobacterium sp. Maddingley MBC34]|nr:MAG: cytochrome c biogenesis protein [Methanobacterium sp. Maddingley MBC34]
MDLAFLLSFLAGAASLMSPCVLKLLPVVVGHSLVKGKFKEILAFTLGFFVVFSIISILTVIFTAAINYYLFYFRIIAAILLIILGVYFVLNKNIFKITNPEKFGNNAFGSFLFGFFTCLAWSPCFGAYVVAVATYSASTGNLFYSAMNMLLFSAGFSLTILVMALLTSKLNIKRLSKYSGTIRVFSGLIIIFAGVYMLLIQFYN